MILKPSRSSSAPLDFSEAEAKPNRGIDHAAVEVAVRQAAIDLREHDPGIGIKFLRKLPIHDKGNGVERSMAGCRRDGGGAVGGCAIGWLVIMVVSSNHIEVGDDGVFHPSPEHIEWLGTCVEGSVVYVCVVDRSAASADEVSRDIIKAGTRGERIAGGGAY